MGRVFEAHLLPVNQPLHGGPRRLGPPYEDSETSEVFWRPSILAVATQGTGGDDETRLLGLLAGFRPEVFAFDRHRKWRSLRQLIKSIFQLRPDLVVMEGTGLGGGLGLLLGRWLAGIPYVVSSGDAVGPFVARLRPI